MGQSRGRQKRRHDARVGPTRGVRDDSQVLRAKQAGMCRQNEGIASEAGKQAGGRAHAASCRSRSVCLPWAESTRYRIRAFETSIPFEVASCGRRRQTTWRRDLTWPYPRRPSAPLDLSRSGRCSSATWEPRTGAGDGGRRCGSRSNQACSTCVAGMQAAGRRERDETRPDRGLCWGRTGAGASA